jgi:hypothetical protein
MSTLRSFGAVLAAAFLWGCGTYVPEIQDFGDSVEGQRLVQAIIFNIKRADHELRQFQDDLACSKDECAPASSEV